MSSLEDTTPVVLSEPLTPERARALTEEVRRDAAALWTKVLDLREGQAHLALGYTSWGAYWEAEFAQAPTRGDQLVRAGRVARALQAAGEPLPKSEIQAGALFPVLFNAPDELVSVWRRVLEVTNGQPTGREIREFVAPFMRERQPPERSQRQRIQEKSTEVARKRRRVALPVRNAHAAAATASESVDDALATDPQEEVIRAWLEDAEAGREHLSKVARRLRRALPPE